MPSYASSFRSIRLNLKHRTIAIFVYKRFTVEMQSTLPLPTTHATGEPPARLGQRGICFRCLWRQVQSPHPFKDILVDLWRVVACV